jgi:hypothetical protein
MNERIKELMIQADYPAPELALRAHKLVELIVQECMNQVREQYLPVLEDELMMKDTHWKGYVQCGVDSYVAIKEHFGVSND